MPRRRRLGPPGTNANLAHPYDFVVGGSGFIQPAVRDATDAVLANATLLVLPATHQIAMSVPKAVFDGVDLAGATYQVALMSHADPNGEGTGGIRPSTTSTTGTRAPTSA